MSDQSQREAIASLLIEHVNKGDVMKVESSLSQFQNDSQWRDIVRTEFPIQELMSDKLRYDLTIPRLLAYEINTLSPFHYAALRGLNEILVNFIDHDIPVDVALTVGTTALHMAAFGGKIECVKMLLDVYKADINKQDRYGWSALHYASTEGHLDVTKILVKYGIASSLRDQDGTSAAFRAQVNGYTDIVEYLCIDDPDVLRVDTAYSADKPLVSSPDGLYSQVWVNKPTVSSDSVPDAADVKERAATMSHKKPNNPKPKLRKSESLPRNFKEKRTSNIRRLIQNELEAIENDTGGGYMSPADILTPGKKSGEDESLVLAGIGVNTLKGVIREEMGKFAKRMLSRGSESEITPISEELPYDLGPAPTPPTKRNDYEDIYETVKLLPPPQNRPKEDSVLRTAPPLPPRNAASVLEVDEAEDIISSLNLKRTSFTHTTDSAALNASLNRIARLVGNDWKILAYALPMDRNETSITDRVSVIERRYPDDHEKQASTSLVEWRINQGDEANIDNLILALRKCGLQSLIDEVDRATQEFTA